jgi:hypothetical protein
MWGRWMSCWRAIQRCSSYGRGSLGSSPISAYEVTVTGQQTAFINGIAHCPVTVTFLPLSQDAPSPFYSFNKSAAAVVILFDKSTNPVYDWLNYGGMPNVV